MMMIIIIIIIIIVIVIIIIIIIIIIISPRSKPPNTLRYQHNILKKPDVDPKYRLCGCFDKTIDHLVSGCPELAKTEYIHQQQGSCTHALDDLQRVWH